MANSPQQHGCFTKAYHNTSNNDKNKYLLWASIQFIIPLIPNNNKFWNINVSFNIIFISFLFYVVNLFFIYITLYNLVIMWK